MSDTVTPSLGFRVVITPTRTDVRRSVGMATRHLRGQYLGFGSLTFLAAVLAWYDGDPAPFLAGMIAGALAAILISCAVALPWYATRRLPSIVDEPLTCEVDEDGIRLRASTWTSNYEWTGFRNARFAKHLVLFSREPGTSPLALPRSAFSPSYEAQFMAILANRGLLARGAITG